MQGGNGNLDEGKRTGVVTELDWVKLLVVHVRYEPFDVFIGRPGPFGNPFSWYVGQDSPFYVPTREEAIIKHEAWLRSKPDLMALVKSQLRGKVLGCYCSYPIRPLPCHGHTLVRVAYEDP